MPIIQVTKDLFEGKPHSSHISSFIDWSTMISRINYEAAASLVSYRSQRGHHIYFSVLTADTMRTIQISSHETISHVCDEYLNLFQHDIYGVTFFSP